MRSAFVSGFIFALLLFCVAFIALAYFQPETLRDLNCMVRTDSTIDYKLCQIFKN